MVSIEKNEIINKVYDASNGGLDIILNIYPQVTTRGHFKLREDEKTASASLKKMDNGIYLVKDFGGADKAKNAIQLYTEYHGLDFKNALMQLANDYQISLPGTPVKNEAKFSTIDLSKWNDGDFDDDNFIYKTKDFTRSELKILGVHVDEKTCNKYGLFSLDWYAVKKEGSVVKVESTENFPMFIFCFRNDENESFYKILQPKSTDKKYRFFWKGKKPKDFIGGFSVLKKEYSKRKAAEAASLAEDNAEVITAEKIDMVFLCSGERDALNMASLGYFVIWLNSETAELSSGQVKQIYANAKELYNIPDLDETGRREGFITGMQNLDIKTIWLPEWLTKKKDWRGNYRKDLCDFFEVFRYLPKYRLEQKVKNLIKKAYPMRFWDTSMTDKGKVTHHYNNVHGLNFLYRNGFCRLTVKEDKEGYKFVCISEHVVKEVKPIDIKDFVYSFLENRNVDTTIRNMMYNTTRLSDNQVSSLPRKELDFTNCSKTMQLLYFSNQYWEITKDNISVHTKNIKKRYVWQSQIIDQKVLDLYSKKIDNRSIKIEGDYFKISKDRNTNTWGIDVLESNCDFLNFLINISRVHWQKELEGEFKSLQEQEVYKKSNLFNIKGDRLSLDEQREQEQHLVNKIFTIGYLLHSYKTNSKAWAVYAIENDLIDDNESHGGSGKSILLKSLQIVLEQKYIEARNGKIWDNNHLFEGVTKHTGYVLFDDANQNFKFDNLYSSITGPMNVNPKNNQPYTIPFNEAPKFAISSNYSLRNSDSSTTRRILFTALSDYYHAESEFHAKKRDPKDDFGYDLFRDWDDSQFNKMFNLLAQCIRFYLSVDEKINPPMNKIRMRNLQSQMGQTFIDWANDFLTNKLDVEFSKNNALDDIRLKKPALKNITSNNFVKRIKAWCEFHSHIYMPSDKVDSSGRIQRSTNGVREDFLYIAKAESLTNLDADSNINIEEIEY